MKLLRELHDPSVLIPELSKYMHFPTTHGVTKRRVPFLLQAETENKLSIVNISSARVFMELEELNTILQELTLITGRQEKQVRYHKTKAQLLTIAFLLLASIIFFSISQKSSSLQCKHWWLPFTIFLLSSLIYFAACIDATTMYYRTQFQLDLNYIEHQLIYKRIHEAKSHSVEIGDHSSTKDQRPHHEIIKPDVVQLIKRKIFISITFSALIGFTVTMLYACRVLLCNGDSEVEVSAGYHKTASSP